MLGGVKRHEHFQISDGTSICCDTIAMPGVSRIGPKRAKRLYLTEWRESRGLTQEQLADRLGVAGMTVSRWETGRAFCNTNVLGAIAEAYGIEPEDFYNHPDSPSANALLRGQPREIREQVISIIKAIRRG